MNNLNFSNKTDAEINSVINLIPSAIIWIDQNYKIKNANDIFLNIFNKTKDQVIDTDLSEYPLQNLQQYFSHIDLLRNREMKIIDHFEIKQEKKTVRFYIKEVESENSFLIMGIDISNEVYRTEAHEEAKRQQEENARFLIIGQIATGVAHEINNPLAIISGFLFNMKRTLEKTETPINIEYFLEKIAKSMINIDRIATIVRGLKFLSKNDLTAPFEDIHIKTIIEYALNVCYEKFKAAGVTLVIDNSTPEMTINCRPVQMTQVVINLLTNALDAACESEQKIVKICFKQDEKLFTISITDSGPGIPLEIRNQIMRPFFTTKYANKGVGLGLSTSKIIVQDHKGELLLDDTNPETTFNIILKNSVKYVAPKK
jgi:C4-dicarboxylate-specific signal transduction histidine kinase